MTYLLNALYALGLTILFPWLAIRSLMTGRYRRGLSQKLFGVTSLPLPNGKPVVWFHGVSVGEINLLATVVKAFRIRHPDWRCVISTTTDTGMAEACKQFAGLTVVFWPFDFSWSVKRTLQSLQPRLIVLAESELWPNFLRSAEKRGVPVVVINGRMSPRSARRYAKLGWLARTLMLSRISKFAMQSEGYAQSLSELGIRRAKIAVTGSVKYDGVLSEKGNSQTRNLAEKLGLTGQDIVWVAGSTHAPEEQIILDVFRRLRVKHPNLRLVLVPRSPDRFDEVARLIDRCAFSVVRRSQLSITRSASTELWDTSLTCPTQSGIPAPVRNGVGQVGDVSHETASVSAAQGIKQPKAGQPDRPAVILLDTMGELNAAWGLADIGFTGGSLDGKRGGQSMIEPAGLGVPVVFGPHVWNFRDAAARLIEAGGAAKVDTATEMKQELLRMLDDPRLRRQMGEAARKLVIEQQGATERTLDVMDEVLGITLRPGQKVAA